MASSRILTITIIVLAGLLSCQKKDTTQAQPEEVSITVSKPTPQQVYKKGDTLFIQAHIAYISQLHGYIARIYNDSTKALLFEKEGHSHSDKIDVNEYWVNTLDMKATLKVELTAIIDHDDHQKTTSVNVISQP
jgi:hypothetical protein